MTELNAVTFDPAIYLSSVGFGRRLIRLKPKQVFFSQGDLAGCVIYIHAGRAKLTVTSERGKEATVTLVGAGDFVGLEAIVGAGEFRQGSAYAITGCVILKIDRNEMLRVLHEERAFSDLFVKFLLSWGMKTQADHVDHLFNSSERRLARALLLMAERDGLSEPETLIPPISQTTLAEMIGTTRSRVCFLMNRFRKLGYIEYKGRVRVHRSMLNMVFHDRLSEKNSS